jgi:hypothetical protein
MERRRRSDAVVKLVTITSIVGWILIAISSMLAIYAKPEQTNFFHELFNLPYRTHWDYSLLDVVYILLIALLLISILGILFNSMRNRRKTDKFRKSLIFQAFMSILGIIILWYNSLI